MTVWKYLKIKKVSLTQTFPQSFPLGVSSHWDHRYRIPSEKLKEFRGWLKLLNSKECDTCGEYWFHNEKEYVSVYVCYKHKDEVYKLLQQQID